MYSTILLVLVMLLQTFTINASASVVNQLCLVRRLSQPSCITVADSR